MHTYMNTHTHSDAQGNALEYAQKCPKADKSKTSLTFLPS